MKDKSLCLALQLVPLFTRCIVRSGGLKKAALIISHLLLLKSKSLILLDDDLTLKTVSRGLTTTSSRRSQRTPRLATSCV